MADSSFYLPSEFLTADDFRTINLPPPPPPSLFRRSSSALTSPGESVVSSADTDTSTDDPDEFIAELTRHLARSAIRDHHHQKSSWAPLATSPQSTLNGFLSSRRSIPTEYGDEEALELVYAAAERAAHIRLACQAQMMKQQQQQQLRGLLGASAPNNHQFPTQAKQRWMVQQQMARNKGVLDCGSGHCGAHSSFPPLSNHRHHHRYDRHDMRAMFLSGVSAPAVNKQAAGTGVFIPRRVSSTNNNTRSPAEYRKKQGGCSTVLLPARVVQALNLNIEEMNSHAHPSNHEILVGRRNAVMMMGQQQRRGIRGEGPMAMEVPLLPQEWTY